MLNKLKNSLLVRLSLVLISISVLAFLSMSHAIYIAETIQGQAGAINESGKLRMRSYRIANNLAPDFWDSVEHWQLTTGLIMEFEAHLRSPRLVNVLQDDPQNSQRLAYEKINQQWYLKIRPLFDLYLEGIVPPSASITDGAIINIRNQYLTHVEDFVEQIDTLVTLLEKDMEEKIQQMHRYQLIALVLTLLLVFSALLLFWRYLILPLKQLLIVAENTAKADFSYRTSYTGNDELGRLGSSFNIMSDELSSLYKDLEQRVYDKTKVLERSNQSLDFLYRSAKMLREGVSPQQNFAALLNDLEAVTGLGPGAICLKSDLEESAVVIASSFDELDSRYLPCKDSFCKNCSNKTLNKNLIQFPIKFQIQNYGSLTLLMADNQKLLDWQLQLIESMVQQMGLALKQAHIETELNKMAVLDERSTIARELHDSLAQSLTFMKIQVSRLYMEAKASDKQTAAAETIQILDELKSGLNAAYKELRQLLNTFRLKPKSEGFNQTLKKAVNDLTHKTELIIDVDNKISFCDFTANEEIHLLQIIREALSNVIQHAKAKKAFVRLCFKGDEICVQIDDDGLGISNQPERVSHYGLVSMRERTEELGGRIDLSQRPSGGTRIELFFEPLHKMNSVIS